MRVSGLFPVPTVQYTVQPMEDLHGRVRLIQIQQAQTTFLAMSLPSPQYARGLAEATEAVTDYSEWMLTPIAQSTLQAQIMLLIVPLHARHSMQEIVIA